MKRKFSCSFREFPILVCALIAALPQPAKAQLYWDSNGATAGAGVTPTGTWGTSTFWTTDAAGLSATTGYTAGSAVVFSAGSDATGSPTITVSGAQTASGLTIQEGTLTFAGTATPSLAIGTGGITMSGTAAATFGATLPITLSGVQSWTNDSSGLLTVAGTVGQGANALTITGTGVTTISGIISGSGGLVKTGAGTLTLSGANTRTGLTTVTTGILRATTSAQALGTGAATLSLGGGTLQLANDTGLNFARNTTVTATSTITADRLTSAATSTTHTLGTLSIGAQTLNVSRGSNITGAGIGGVTFGATTLTGAATFAPAANATLTLGAVSGAFGITKSGAGTLTLGGIIGTGAGGLSVTGGTLIVGLATNTFTGNVTVDGSSSILQINAVGNNATSGPLGIFTGGLSYKTVTLSNGGIFRPNVTYNVNAPTAALPGNGQIFSIAATGGVFDVPTGVTFTVDDGSGSGVLAAASQLQGSGPLTKTGAGVLTLGNGTASNAVFTGQILVNAGVLRLGAIGAAGVGLGATSANTVIASGAGFDISNNASTAAEPLSIDGSGVGGTGNVIFTSHATGGSFSGPITLAGNSTIGSAAAGAMTFNAGATFALGSNTLTIRNTSTGRVFTDGVISGAGSVTINHSGTGDYVPRADHTYSGGTTLTAGLVAVDRDSIGSPGAPTSGPFGTGTLTLAGGQIRSGTGSNRTVGNAVTISGDMTFFSVASEKNLTFSGPITLSGGTRTFTANAGTTVAGISTIFSGAVGDGGNNLGLIKTGTGNLTLGGANTYTGGTTVNSGALILSGSLASNTALTVSPSVAAGALFSLASGGVNPLGNVSTLTLGSATGPTSIGLELGANTAGSDSITSPNAATATGAINFGILALPGFGSAPSYNLISAASGLTSSSPTYGISSAPGGFTYSLTTTDSLVSLNVAAGPTGDLFWRGDTNSSWSAFSSGNTNWYTTAAGTINAQANPGAANTVFFSTTNATGPTISTSLNNDFTIKNLVFSGSPTGVTGVTIAAGVTPASLPGVLTITPSSVADGISLPQGSGAVTISAPVVLGASQTWSVDSSTPGAGTASSLTVSGPVSGGAGSTLTFTTSAGTTPIILSGVGSTYSGASTISASTIVQGGAANALSPNTAWTVHGTLNTGDFNQNTGSLVGGVGIVQNGSANARILTIGSDNVALATFGGIIQNGGVGTLALTKTGTGIQVLSGTNTYTGLTTVNDGTLRLGSATALNAANNVTLSGNGSLDLFGNDQTIGTLVGAATNTITNSGSGTGTNTLNVTGALATLPSLIIDGSTAKTALRVVNGLGGDKITTNGANTFSGGLILANNASGTRLAVGTITGTPWGSGPITVGEAATDKAGIFFANANQTLTNPIISNTGLGTDRVGTFRVDALGTVLSGQLTANLAPVTFGTNGTGAVTATGKITGPEGLTLMSSSLGGTALTVTLNNAGVANDYSGDTKINESPQVGKTFTLALGAANQIPNGAGKGNVSISTNGTGVGTLNLAGFSETINGLNGNGTVEGLSGTPTLTLGDNNASGSFSGIIQNTAGTLTLTKVGTGTQILSGASTFAGPINVDGGLIAFASAPAASGPLGNSTVVNLNGGGLSFTATGTTAALNRSVAIGAGTGTFDVTGSTSTLTVGALTSSGGNLIKTGAGKLQLTSTTTLSGGAGVSVTGGTLQAGFGTNGIASISVGASGYLAFQNSVAETLTLGSSGTAFNLANGARLGFELNGLTNDGIIVPTGGGLALGGIYTFDFFNTGSGVTANTYTLLTAPAGSVLNSFTYTLGDAPVGYNYSFITSDTMVQLQTVAYTPTYWNNTQTTNSWATTSPGTNFTSDATGLTEIGHTPLGTETVIFNTSALAGPSITTTLDGNHTVDSLQFNGAGTPATTTVTIGQGTGGTLTLKPASSSGGIAILAGGGNAVISAPLTLDGTLASSQTWKVSDASSTLTISGNVNFGADVAKSGDGTLILSGTNTGAGDLNLNAGKLHLNSAAALGSGTLTIGAGTSIDNSSGSSVTLSGNGPTSVNGDFSFVGSNGLTLGTGAVTLANNPTITTTSQTLTVPGAVGGSSGFSKDGAGNLLLTAANSYTGLTTINGGVLRITHGSALGGIGAGTAQSGSSALELDGTSGAISVGNEPLSINGGGISNAGALRNIAGNNSYAGTISLAAQSRINSDSGTLTLTNPTSINGVGQTLVVGGLGNTTINGAIDTAAGGVIKDGTGVLTLAGANTYLGNTDIRSGTLNLTGSLTGNGTATTGPLLLYGSAAGNTVVNVTGNIVNYQRFTGATVATANAAYIQTSGNVNFTSTQANNPTNAVATAGYGYMEITGGTLKANGRLAPSNGVGSTGVIYIGGSGTLDHTGGEWLLMSYSASGNGGKSMITVDTGGTLDRVGSSNLFGLNMDRTNGYAVLNIAGGSVLNSNRAITFGNGTGANITGTSGFLNLAAGTLQIGANMANGNTGAGSTGNNAYLNFSGGTLKAQAALTNAIPVTAANQTFTSTIYGAINNNGTAHDFTGGLIVDTNTFATTLANNLVAPSADGVGASSLTITGGSGYIGAPMVEFTGGTLAAGGAPASGYAVVSGGVVTDIIITAPGSYTAAPTLTLTGGGGTGASVAVSTLVANTSGGLTKNNNGVLTLSGTNTYTGATVINAGTLQLGSAGTVGSLSPTSVITNNSILAINRTNAAVQGTDFGVINGTGSFNQAGTGSTTLNAANGYAGGTSITGGILVAGHANALGAGNVSINGGVSLVVQTGVTISNPITIGTNAGASGHGLVEAGTTAGVSTVAGAVTINNGAAAGGIFGAPTAGTTLHVQGAITSSVPVTSRLGTVMFSGGGTGYTDMTVGQGTVKVGANHGIATSATVLIGASAAGNLDLNGFNQSLVGIVKGANAAIIGNSSTTADSIITTTGTSTYAGIIQDTLGAGTRKVGLTVQSGTLTLTGTANTYTGPTIVDGGTLNIATGSSIVSSSLLTVNTGGVLSGSGTIGSTLLTGGSEIRPGNSPGMLTTTGDLTVTGPATFVMDLAGAVPTTGYDQLSVSGVVDLGFTSILSLNVTFAPVEGDKFFLLLNNGASPISGNFSGIAEGSIIGSGGYHFEAHYGADSTSGSLTGGNDFALVAVPETSSMLLVMLSVGTLIFRRRR